VGCRYDLHKCKVTLVVKNEAAEVVIRTRIACLCANKIQDFFLTLPRSFKVVVETIGFYQWFWDLIEPLTDAIILAHATEFRHRSPAETKSDFRDAKRLAELLWQGLFKTDHHLSCYVPEPTCDTCGCSPAGSSRKRKRCFA